MPVMIRFSANPTVTPLVEVEQPKEPSAALLS
jgi:hypothetical protein